VRRNRATTHWDKLYFQQQQQRKELYGAFLNKHSYDEKKDKDLPYFNVLIGMRNLILTDEEPSRPRMIITPFISNIAIFNNF